MKKEKELLKAKKKIDMHNRKIWVIGFVENKIQLM